MYKIIKVNRVILIIFLIMSILLGTLFCLPKEESRAVAESESGEYVKVPILMYHSILKDSKRHGKYIISPDEFENDLKHLMDNGYTCIVMQDLIDYVYDGSPLPEKPVMLTFDDGYYNNYVYAYPLLEKYNAKIVISIVGTYTDLYTKNKDMNPYYAHLNWDNVNELLNSGRVEIQNHSYNLHIKDNKRDGAKKNKAESLESYKKLLNADLGRLQSEALDNCEYTPTTFTYPFGAVSDISVNIIKEMGFKASLSCAQKINIIKKDNPDCLYRLNRFIRSHNTKIESIL